MSHFRIRAHRSSLVLALCLPVAGAAQAQCSWQPMSAPSPGDLTNGILESGADSLNTRFVLGTYTNNGGTWPINGQRYVATLEPGGWSTSDVPIIPGASAAAIQAMAVSPAGDVWVGGELRRSNFLTEPALLRWRQGSWDWIDTIALAPQSTPPNAPRSGWVESIVAVADDDVWAMGHATADGDGSSTVPMALHFDGATWSEVDVPGSGNRLHSVAAVRAFASDDIWAVGHSRDVGGAFLPLVIHWDGASWSHVATPFDGVGQTFFTAIDGLSSSDFWVVGETPGGGALLHREGAGFVAHPSPLGATTRLAAVTVRSATEAWASSTLGTPVLLSWDGSVWSLQQLPPAPPTAVSYRPAVVLSGDAAASWMFGTWSDGTASHAIAHRQALDCQVFADGFESGDLGSWSSPVP